MENVIMIQHLFVLLLLSSSLAIAQESYIQTAQGNVPLKLEHALTDEQRIKGLSHRKFLPANEGMLFHFDPPRIVSIWMYETEIDLSLAYLDEKSVIREIHELKSYPDVHNPLFFISKAVPSSFKTSYALEMNAHWFSDHNIQVGDFLKEAF